MERCFGGDTHPWQAVVVDVLEIEPNGVPEPDIALVEYRADFYRERHPNAGDALLVIEVGDNERNPREKMRAYTNDGRIRLAWRIDIPSRSRFCAASKRFISVVSTSSLTRYSPVDGDEVNIRPEKSNPYRRDEISAGIAIALRL